MSSPSGIPGYALGAAEVPPAPITMKEFEWLKEAVLFTAEDVKALNKSRQVLENQIEAILDVWYSFIASKPFLLDAFRRKSDGQADEHYLASVRRRFGKWILDTADANYDQKWLDYQFEIGRRHHRTAKNKTDGVEASDVIQFRYLPTVVFPITETLKPFLRKGGHSPQEVEAMHSAWVKSVLLQVTLWCYPYIKQGDF